MACLTGELYMGNDNSKIFSGSADGYSIDDILEEARRHQTEQKNEQSIRQKLEDERRQRTQTDIDLLLQSYDPTPPPAHVEETRMQEPKTATAEEPENIIIPDEKPLNGSTVNSPAQPKAQPKPPRGRASSAISATGTLFETISVEKNDMDDYYPHSKRRSEPSAPTQTDFTEYIKRSQKADAESAKKPSRLQSAANA